MGLSSAARVRGPAPGWIVALIAEMLGHLRCSAISDARPSQMLGHLGLQPGLRRLVRLPRQQPAPPRTMTTRNKTKPAAGATTAV